MLPDKFNMLSNIMVRAVAVLVCQAASFAAAFVTPVISNGIECLAMVIGMKLPSAMPQVVFEFAMLKEHDAWATVCRPQRMCTQPSTT